MNSVNMTTEKNYRPLLVIAAFFIVFYLLPLAARPLLDPDETRYAEISREMIASGNWIVPKLNGLRYFEKPAMGYWLNSGSMMIFGMNRFGIRFASALATGITALMIYLLAKREIEQNTGLASALIYLLSAEVFFIGTTAVLDSMLSMALAGSFTLFYFSFHSENMKKRLLYLALFGAVTGFAFLIKGFLVFAVTGSACGVFLIWEFSKNKFAKLKVRPPVMTVMFASLQFFTILIPMLLVILPWSIEIGLKEPDFWRFFIMEEHIQRFMGEDAQHAEPFFFYLPILLAGLLPWSLLLPFCIAKWRKFKLDIPIIKYSLCWFLVPFIFFSISKGKLPTYILPIFPPVAILFAFGMKQFLSAPNWKNDYLKWVIKLFIAAICIVMASIIVLQITGVPGLKGIDGHRLSLYSMREEWWKFVIVALTATVWIITLLKSLKNDSLKNRLQWFCVGPALLLICCQIAIPDIVIDGKAPGDFINSCRHEIDNNTVVISEHRIARAICWYLKRKNVYLLYSANEFGYGINYDDASRHRMLDRSNAPDFIAKNKGHIALFLTERKYRKYVLKNHLLPPPRRVITSRDFVLMEY